MWQLEQFTPYLGNRVIDVGCGLGNFAEILLDRERYIGIDSDQDIIEKMKDQYADTENIEFFQADITQWGHIQALAYEKADSILCVNVLEHIKDDRGALKNIAAILPWGGHVCLLVPAFQCLYGTLDSLDGHFRRYTKAMVMDRIRNLPVEIVHLYYFNMVGSLGWFFKGRVLREKTQSNANYAVMNMLIPLFSKIERAIKPFFGMSLIAILRKSSSNHERI
jgi:SAM-dependent methyltransferase